MKNKNIIEIFELFCKYQDKQEKALRKNRECYDSESVREWYNIQDRTFENAYWWYKKLNKL